MVSDSRTHAGVDYIASFRNMCTWTAADRVICLLSAGNLGTSQSVVNPLQQRQDEGVLAVSSMFDLAALLGSTLREVSLRDEQVAQQNPHVDFSCSFLLGGQIAGGDMRLYNIYPQGNFIESTPETPYLQIGESKYGKPILDRVIRYDIPLMQAAKCVLVSFDSTLRSNLSVGMPLDLLLYRRDSLKVGLQARLDEGDLYLSHLRQSWSSGLRQLFMTIPDPPWSI